MSETETFYSTDQESFEFSSEDDALEDLDVNERLVPGATYESGVFESVDLASYLNPDWILEEANDRLYDNLGHGDDDAAFSASPEGIEELRALLKAWAAKHLTNRQYWQPTGRSTTHTVTAEQIAEYRRANP